MLKSRTGVKEILRKQNLTAISRQVSYISLLDVSAGNSKIALVDGSAMIRTQMGSHNTQEMIAVQGSPCASAPPQ
jgi:hypothetical protein